MMIRGSIYFGLILLIISVFSLNSFASEMITIPAEQYKNILLRLERLEKKVQQMEKAREKERMKEKRIRESIKEVNEDIDDIYDTLDQVQTKTILDKINFGAELRLRMDFFDLHNTISSRNPNRKTDYHNNNFWSTRFRLNMEADITHNLNFHGRLAVYKNWADSDRIYQGFYMDANRAHVPDDTTLKLDRAYVDWIVPDLPIPLAITLGRHPSTEGPPFEFRENRKRQSTYPALIIDGEADGIVVTLGLERYLKIRNCGFRIAYGKAYQDDDDQKIYLDSRDTGINDSDMLGLFFEGEIPKLKESLFVLSYVKAWSLVDSVTSAKQNLGDLEVIGVHLQAQHFPAKDLDIFISAGLNRSDPNGHTTNIFGQPLGLLSNYGQTSHIGWALYTGFRYTLPFTSLHNAKVGFEYNHGSRYWLSFTWGSTDIYNRLATRGNAYDFYYIQSINKYLFLRTGFTYIDYDYTGSGFHLGRPKRTDEELTNFYMLIDVRF